MNLCLNSVQVRRKDTLTLDIPLLELDSTPTLLLGVNGAGKSTLFSALAGRIKTDQGRVKRDKKIAYVEQHFRPIVGFSTIEYCAYVAWLFGQERRRVNQDASSWLTFVNLQHRVTHPCNALSGGEQARLAIATALNTGAEVLLLDEPSAALDPLSKAQLSEIYGKVAEIGQSLVVSTHDVGDLQPPFQRILVLHEGSLFLMDLLMNFLTWVTAAPATLLLF